VIVKLHRTLVNMPSIKSAKVRAVVTRSAPYPASKPTNNTANRENALPLDSASPAATPLPASKDKPAAKKTAAKKTSAPKKDTATRVRLDLPDSYLDIELEEAVGFQGDIEVPCYDNARLTRAVPSTTNMLRLL
jgi:hypothetical protein